MVDESEESSPRAHPPYYRIRVAGRLSPEWSDFLQGLEIQIIEENDKAFTVLTGLLQDQAALMGVLQHLYNCGIEVISVESASRKFNIGEITEQEGEDSPSL